LIELNMSRTQKLTDRGLQELSDTRIQRLSLRAPRVTDEGLRHMSRIKSLQMLTIEDAGISDAGLRQLQSLSGLRFLRLTNTAVSEAALAELRRSLPNLLDPKE
jgi:hypothetical protein